MPRTALLEPEPTTTAATKSTAERLANIGSPVWVGFPPTRGGVAVNVMVEPAIVYKVVEPLNPRTKVYLQVFGSHSGIFREMPFADEPKIGHWCWPVDGPAPPFVW